MPGILPDGDFKRNTRIEYCCRLDGDTNVKIVLPTSDPFYLLKYGDLCQEVSSVSHCSQSKQLHIIQGILSVQRNLRMEGLHVPVHAKV